MDAPEQLTAWTYGRQSKDHEANLANQDKDTGRHADRRGWLIPEDGKFADNDVSASKSRKGTAFDRMIQLIKSGKGPDVLVITYMDRLYRKPIELEEIIPVIEMHGVLISTVYEGDVDLRTDTGQTFARITVALARQEVMRKGRRQKRANLERAENGDRSPHSRVPFGWNDDRVTLNEAEADAIRWAYDHVLLGGSIGAIRREWAERGLKPRSTGRERRNKDGVKMPYRGNWTNPSVTHILTSPGIAGFICLPNSTEIIGRGNWQPIITDEEKFFAVRAILRDPERATAQGSLSLGSGVYYCRCGARMERSSRSQRSKAKGADQALISYPIYKCQELTPKKTGKFEGPHVTQRAERVDAYVELKLLDRMSQPDAVEIFANRAGAEDVPKLRKERKEISDGLARMMGDEALGIVPRAIYLEAAKRITARLEEIEQRIEEAGQMDAAALLVTADDPGEVWRDLDISIQRKVVDSLMHVTLRTERCGCRLPDIETICRIAWLGC